MMSEKKRRFLRKEGKNCISSYLPGEHSAEVDLARGPAEERRLGQVLRERGVVEPDVGLDELFLFLRRIFFLQG